MRKTAPAARETRKRTPKESFPSIDKAGVKFELKSAFQRQVFKSIKEHDIVGLIGMAGSAKTMLSIYTAMTLLNSEESPIKKIFVVRLAQETMGESIGALPGLKEEKLYYAIAPIIDNMSLFCNPMKIKKLFEEEIIEVIPVSHLRGRSLANSFIIVEECQNLEPNMVLTILTRIGLGSKMVFTGDPAQMDFKSRNGVDYLIKMLTGISNCEIKFMPSSEIYRHPVIPELLVRAQELGSKNVT